MAKDIPYTPVFPYTGKQTIIDSDRVTLNSKEDMTFLTAKKAVSISSGGTVNICLLYTSPSPRDRQKSRMPSSA